MTESIPKTLIEVNGRPFASLQLQWLSAQGVDRVLYCVGHLGEMVKDYVRDGSRWGLQVEYVTDPVPLAGTAGALRLAADLGALESEFFLLYGDSYLSVDLADVEATYRAGGTPGLMTVFRNDGKWDRSNVVFRDGMVHRYEKGCPAPPPDMRYIDYGLSILTRAVIEELVSPARPADLAPVLSALAERGLLRGYEVQERFYEIGTPEGIRELESRLTEHPRSLTD